MVFTAIIETIYLDSYSDDSLILMWRLMSLILMWRLMSLILMWRLMENNSS